MTLESLKHRRLIEVAAEIYNAKPTTPRGNQTIKGIYFPDAENKEVDIEVKQSNGFFNIRGVEAPQDFKNQDELNNELEFGGKLTPESAKKVNETFAGAPMRKSVKGSAYEKDPVGLAVEVFVALADDIKHGNADTNVVMEQCIKLVKQTQKAFM